MGMIHAQAESLQRHALGMVRELVPLEQRHDGELPVSLRLWAENRGCDWPQKSTFGLSNSTIPRRWDQKWEWWQQIQDFRKQWWQANGWDPMRLSWEGSRAASRILRDKSYSECGGHSMRAATALGDGDSWDYGLDAWLLWCLLSKLKLWGRGTCLSCVWGW